MITPNSRNRPDLATEAVPEGVATHRQDTGVTRANAIDRLDGAYAVLVIGAVTRRRLYLNLPAAQRAVDRATARGAAAHMILVRLVPVDGGDLEAVSVDAH